MWVPALPPLCPQSLAAPPPSPTASSESPARKLDVSAAGPAGAGFLGYTQRGVTCTLHAVPGEPAPPPPPSPPSHLIGLYCHWALRLAICCPTTPRACQARTRWGQACSLLGARDWAAFLRDLLCFHHLRPTRKRPGLARPPAWRSPTWPCL